MLAGVVAAVGGTVAFLFSADGLPSDVEFLDLSTATRGGEADDEIGALGRPQTQFGSRQSLDEPWRETWPDDDLSNVVPSAPPALTQAEARPELAPTQPEVVLPRGAAPATPVRAPLSPASDSALAEIEAILLSLESPAPPAATAVKARPRPARSKLEDIGAELDAIEREIAPQRKRAKPAPP